MATCRSWLSTPPNIGFWPSGIETIVGAHLGNADGFRLAEPKPEAILDWRSALGIRNQMG
jgi:hypothetical protein